MQALRSAKVNPQYGLVHAMNLIKMVNMMVQSPTSVWYLCKTFDLDSRTIYRKLTHMRQNGFEFEKHPGHKLKITALPDDLEELIKSIKTFPITPKQD